MSTLTAFGNLYTTVETINTADPIVGGSVSGTTLTLTRKSNANPVTLTLGTGTGGTTIPFDYKLNTLAGTLSEAKTDAAANHIGILPGFINASTADVDVVLHTTAPADGTAYRYFVNGDASESSKKYIMKFGTTEVAAMRNGEAYTFIWNSTLATYFVIPGIINAKKK